LGPTSGSIRALGLDIAAVAAGEDGFHFHREVGLVFQDPDIQLFSATVLDDVAFGPLQLGPHPKDEVKERCDEAMARWGSPTWPTARRSSCPAARRSGPPSPRCSRCGPTSYSSTSPRPRWIPRTKWVLVDLIQRLAAAGRTLIVATHELDIVPLIADRVVVLSEEGRVMADGTPAAILADRDLLIRANLIHEHLHEHGPWPIRTRTTMPTATTNRSPKPFGPPKVGPSRLD
jgi:cobalt/nickel transport system ATP-binding protein